jgi:hypothetical protein
MTNELWHMGPEWSRMTEDNWPKYTVNITDEDLLGDTLDITATGIDPEKTPDEPSLKEDDSERLIALPTIESDIKHTFEDFITEEEYKATVSDHGDIYCTPNAIPSWKPHKNQTSAVMLSHIRAKGLLSIYDIHSIGKWSRAVRAFAQMKRWLHNDKSESGPLGRNSKPEPTRAWIWRVTMDLIRIA